MQDAAMKTAGDPALLIRTEQAGAALQTSRRVRVSTENVRLEKFWARVYVNCVGDEVVSIRIDRWKHGTQVWENPTNASVERVKCLIRAERGW